MRSMTGYGKGEAVLDGRHLTVELKSVNHRFVDLNMRMPRAFMAYEDLFRTVITANVARGHIDVYVNYEDSADRQKQVKVDMGLARAYILAANSLQNEFDLRNDFQLNSLLKTPEVLSVEVEEDSMETIKDLINEAAKNACCALNNMREAEGAKLKTVLNKLVDNIEALVQKIDILAPLVADDFRKKIEERVREALKEVQTDETRLLNEVAFFADRSNIDEELARLKSHITQIRIIFESNDSVGKKLDFLVQEFNREANTICSKSNNLELTQYALSLKNEIEKVREQIQNVE